MLFAFGGKELHRDNRADGGYEEDGIDRFGRLRI
jgi:hypothetical protein